jgi:hypothetical protein
MKIPMRVAFCAAALAVVAGCTTGQSNGTPPIASGGGPTGHDALQLRVGTVEFSLDHSIGINVLETFRDASGYTALPITAARLRGPSGFVAPLKSKDPGAGHHGSIPIGSASNQFVIGSAGATTIYAGADGWGIGPPGCSCPGVNFYPFQPQFADAALPIDFPGGPEPFYGGPPAYPPTIYNASAISALVSIPSGWAEGFYFVGLTKAPPSGTYALDVSYEANGMTVTKTATAVLDSSKLLPGFVQAEVTSDHKGGLSVHVDFKPGIKQVIVNVIDANVPPANMSPTACTTGTGFASLVFSKSGTQRVPDNLGNLGNGGARTFCKGDLLNVQAIGFDYDDFHLGPPSNSQQTPPLPNHPDATYSSTITLE